MDFIIGCNYWASHAGTEMWVDWNAKTVEEDLKQLSLYGIKYMRVFPIWRDFQPVAPHYKGAMTLGEYRMKDGSRPTNPYYIDEQMIERFRTFCKLAEKYGIKLIVGIVTGWMSGRMFVPEALNNLNLFTDPRAIMLTLKFVRGFVKMTKDLSVIEAWDLGNECNCMSAAPSREVAYNWSASVSNAIKAEDPQRDVISGMHGLRLTNEWTIADQGELTDVLTTHPYPYWVAHTRADKTISTRTLLHAPAESELYAALGGKPVLVEEVGTMGPEVCSEENAAIFMRSQLFSAYVGGHRGVLWWCAFDQNGLDTTPYDWIMIERYLGLFKDGYKPKAELLELKRIGEALTSLNLSLPSKKTDAVCLLSHGIDHWAVAYMTYVLARQSELDLTFADVDGALPDSDCYLLPSVKGVEVMNKRDYEKLKEKVRCGATLYVSSDGGIMTEFEELFGARIIDSSARQRDFKIDANGESLTLSGCEERILEVTTAEVLLSSKEGEPVLLKNKYGKGTIYYLSCPLEASLAGECCDSFSKGRVVYDCFAQDIRATHPAHTLDPAVCMTLHKNESEIYVTYINYSDSEKSSYMEISPEYNTEILYGTADRLAPGECCILKLLKKEI